MPLEPVKLAGCGVGGLVTELNNGVSARPCMRDTSSVKSPEPFDWIGRLGAWSRLVEHDAGGAEAPTRTGGHLL